MSVRNKTKDARRAERAAKVHAPALMLAVRKADVLGHRYLRDHGLNFSNTMASVGIPGDPPRKVSGESQA